MRNFDWNYMTPDPSSWEVHSNTPRHQDVYVIEYQMYHVTHAVLCKCYRGTCISHQESNQTELALGQSCPCSFLKWRTMRKGWVQWWSSLRGIVESAKRDCALHCMIVLQCL